jgi:hypothetical protein
MGVAMPTPIFFEFPLLWNPPIFSGSKRKGGHINAQCTCRK